MEDVVRHLLKTRTLARINLLRRELLFRRAISPVRELVNGFLRSESSDLLNDHNACFILRMCLTILRTGKDLAENRDSH